MLGSNLGYSVKTAVDRLVMACTKLRETIPKICSAWDRSRQQRNVDKNSLV